MDRASISRPTSPLATPAFTLIEVVVSLGVLAVTVVAVLALQNSISAAVAEVLAHHRAAQLPDAVDVELRRLRDLPVPEGPPIHLDALAGMIPSSESPSALRLVAAKDGTHVIRESETDDPAMGLARRDRFFLIEVRQQPAPLNYVREAGYLALTLTLTWPYQIPTGSGPGDAVAADRAQASTMVFHCALTP